MKTRRGRAGQLVLLATTLGTAGLARAQNSKLVPTERQLKETEPFIDMPEPQGKPSEEATGPKDEKDTPGYLAGYRKKPFISMAPHVPQGYIAVPGLAPAFGGHAPGDAMHFEVHGYLQAPVRVGIGSRESVAPGQSSTTLHGDPIVPGMAWGWFEQNPAVPWPWAHVSFTYGNDTVQATTTLGAWNLSESMSSANYFQAPAQMWFADAYVTYTPKIGRVGLKVVAGVFPEYYGQMAQYTSGAYSTHLVGAIRGAGTRATLTFPFEYDLDLKLESGFKGNINYPPTKLIPAPSNDYASAAQGSTFAWHGHASLTYRDRYTLAAHYIHSFSQDDRRDGFDDPSTAQDESLATQDGTLKVCATDVTIHGGRFGHFYAGVVDVAGQHVESLNNLVRVQNAGGGKELLERFFGPNSHGNGGLLLAGSQYTLSLGTLLRYPVEFWGEGPDLQISLFGLYGSTRSEDVNYDDKQMFKYGSEVLYSFFPWMAVSGRVDHVVPDTRDMTKSFVVVSPKLVFRSDWSAREAITLQYTTYLLGDNVVVNGDTRLMNNPGGRPDKHMVAAYGTIWW